MPDYRAKDYPIIGSDESVKFGAKPTTMEEKMMEDTKLLRTEDDVVPQHQMLKRLQNCLPHVVSTGVTIDVENEYISFKLQSGGKIPEKGANGCSLSDIIAIAHFMAGYYLDKYPHNEDEGVFINLNAALKYRIDFERKALIRNRYDEAPEVSVSLNMKDK